MQYLLFTHVGSLKPYVKQYLIWNTLSSVSLELTAVTDHTISLDNEYYPQVLTIMIPIRWLS